MVYVSIPGAPAHHNPTAPLPAPVGATEPGDVSARGAGVGLGVLAGASAMVCVGSSVAVSGQLVGAPLFTAQAVRYAAACLLLLIFARVAGRPVVLPRGREWLWLAGVTVTGLVVFNIALVHGSRHAEPAVLGVAVACVPIVLAASGPLLEGGRPRPTVLAAALVVTCGAVLVQGLGRSDGTGLAWAGVVFGCEVGFTLLAVPVLGRHGPWGVSVHATWLAAVVFAVLGLLREGPGRHDTAGCPRRPGGRLPRHCGHRGGVRAVVLQRRTPGRQPCWATDRGGTGSRRSVRGCARRGGAAAAGVAGHRRRSRRARARPAPQPASTQARPPRARSGRPTTEVR